MGMNKYTLFCQEGRLLRSGAHFLMVGDWVPYCEGYVILQHGVLSDLELKQLQSQTLVNVYQDMKSKVVSIIAPYDDKYLSRHPDLKSLTGYIGYLHRVNKHLFSGMLHIK